MTTVRLTLAISLPGSSHARTACVSGVLASLRARRGVVRSHLADEDTAPTLFVEYDPHSVSVRTIAALAKEAGAGIAERYESRVLPLLSIASPVEARRLEEALCGLPGVLAVSVNPVSRLLRIEFDRTLCDMKRIERFVGVRDASVLGTFGLWPWNTPKRRILWSLATAMMLLSGFLFERWLGEPRLALGAYVIAYAVGGIEFVGEAVGRRVLAWRDAHGVVIVTALGAASVGAWGEGALLLCAASVARAARQYALAKVQNTVLNLETFVSSLVSIQSKTQLREVSIDSVTAGQVLLIRPNEPVPVDGQIVAGEGWLSQKVLTRESQPVHRTVGDRVSAGEVNGQHTFWLRAVHVAGDRMHQRLRELVLEAQTYKTPSAVMADRFVQLLFGYVLVVAALFATALVWLGLTDIQTSVYRSVAFAVAASPWALAFAAPVTVLVTVVYAARRGVFFRDGAALKDLGIANVVALGNTATVAVDPPQITDVLPIDATDEVEFLQIVVAVLRKSRTPVAGAIVRYAESHGLPPLTVGDVESVPGGGLRAVVKGRVVEVGSLRHFDDQRVDLPRPLQVLAGRLVRVGRNVTIARAGDRWLGVIGTVEKAGAGIPQILSRLREAGVKRLVMMTDDHVGAARAIGREIGADEIRGGLLPMEAAQLVTELRAIHGSVAVVGDGARDRSALAQATVGIAVGAASSPAIDTAHVALAGTDLRGLLVAVGAARRARMVIRQNTISHSVSSRR